MSHAVARLATARTLAELTTIVRTVARDMLRADGVTFVLRDGDSCFYYDEEAIAPLWKGRRFPMTSCVSGWAMTHGMAAVIPDIYRDSRVPADAYRATFVKSLLMVPVGTVDPPAAIGAYWASHHTASAEEVATLRELADAAAATLSEICPHCHQRGFVRIEHVIARATPSRHFYCGACEHTWRQQASAGEPRS